MHLKQTKVAANKLGIIITSYKQEKQKSYTHSHSELVPITLKIWFLQNMAAYLRLYFLVHISLLFSGASLGQLNIELMNK